METRKSCLDCCLKHLGQAIVLLMESKKGYPAHKYIALGHLAEAEDESIDSFEELANEIRDTRVSIQDGNEPNKSIEELIGLAIETKSEKGSGCSSC